MIIQYRIHASFLFTSQKGIRLLTDPYSPPATRLENMVNADVVLVSHSHHDHSDLSVVKGAATVINGAGPHVFEGIKIQGFTADHGTVNGRWAGMVVCYRFDMDNITCLHMGDIGVSPTDAEIKAFGPIDILMIPVGGHYTVNAAQARKIMERINPKIAIPMHYAAPGVDREKFPIAGVEPFLADFPRVKRIREPEFKIKADALPEKTEIWVLTPQAH